MRRALRRVAAAVSLLLAACAGIFQHGKPAVPMAYSVVLPVSAADPLRVGSAERDITPPVGCYMGGFDLGRTSTGVATPLKVRVLVVATAARSFAIVGVDNLGLQREDVDWIKRGLPGFALGDVFVCSSHTHAGPDMVGLWGYYLMTTGRDREYLAALRTQVAAAVAEARANAVPAAFVQGEAFLPPRGLVKNSNRAEVFDRRITVLQARALDDHRPVGTLLHMACHPEVLPRRNTELSADFVGELCDEWKRRGRGQAVFANGALGAMVSPDVRPRDLVGTRRLGGAICDLAERALAAAAPLAVDAIEVRRRDVYLPVETLGFRLGRLTAVLQRELFDGCARSTVGWLRLGAFEAVAVPGEMEPALAARLRADLGRPNLVLLGLCDDELGYLLREQEARDPEFAYERSMSVCLFAGEIVCAAIGGGTGRGVAGVRTGTDTAAGG